MLIRFGDRELVDTSARRLLWKCGCRKDAPGSRVPHKLSLTGFAQRRHNEAEPNQKRWLHAQGGVHPCEGRGWRAALHAGAAVEEKRYQLTDGRIHGSGPSLSAQQGSSSAGGLTSQGGTLTLPLEGATQNDLSLVFTISPRLSFSAVDAPHR